MIITGLYNTLFLGSLLLKEKAPLPPLKTERVSINIDWI